MNSRSSVADRLSRIFDDVDREPHRQLVRYCIEEGRIEQDVVKANSVFVRLMKEGKFALAATIADFAYQQACQLSLERTHKHLSLSLVNLYGIFHKCFYAQKGSLFELTMKVIFEIKVERVRKSMGVEDPGYAIFLSEFAMFLASTDRHDLAMQNLKIAESIFQKKYDSRHPLRVSNLNIVDWLLLLPKPKKQQVDARNLTEKDGN